MWETDIQTYRHTDIQTDGTDSSIVAHFVRGNYKKSHSVKIQYRYSSIPYWLTDGSADRSCLAEWPMLSCCLYMASACLPLGLPLFTVALSNVGNYRLVNLLCVYLSVCLSVSHFFSPMVTPRILGTTVWPNPLVWSIVLPYKLYDVC